MSTGNFPLPADIRLPDNAGVATEGEILAERVQAKLNELGRTARAVSLQATGKPDTVRDVLRRKAVPGGEILARLADALGTTSDWLIGRVENPAQVKSEVSFREVPSGFRDEGGDRLRVLGTGYCEDLVIDDVNGGNVEIERIMLETDHVIQLVARPPALLNSPDAYGIYFHGSSMEPRFYQGELGVVDPRRHPGPGDFVVVQLNDGSSDEVITVLVKQLVRIAGGFVELRQFNPDATFRIERRRVARLQRILTSTELLR